MITFYLYPRCTNSRDALHLIEAVCARDNLLLDVIHYRQVPLTVPVLLNLQKQLDITIREMVRIHDSECEHLDLSTVTDMQVLQMLIKQPKLLQRPIVAYQHFAVIAQPAELIETLFCAPDMREALREKILTRVRTVEPE